PWPYALLPTSIAWRWALAAAARATPPRRERSKGCSASGRFRRARSWAPPAAIKPAPGCRWRRLSWRSVGAFSRARRDSTSQILTRGCRGCRSTRDRERRNAPWCGRPLRRRSFSVDRDQLGAVLAAEGGLDVVLGRAGRTDLADHSGRPRPAMGGLPERHRDQLLGVVRTVLDARIKGSLAGRADATGGSARWPAVGRHQQLGVVGTVAHTRVVLAPAGRAHHAGRTRRARGRARVLRACRRGRCAGPSQGQALDAALEQHVGQKKTDHDQKHAH